MHVISASRRTDIPAFYMPWFMNRLRAGEVQYPNPFSKQVYTLALTPADVHSIVFWSKHYGPFLKHIDELEERGYLFYCHYTITGAPRSLEPFVPAWEQSIVVFRRLASRTSPAHVQWRFDPILLTDELDADFYVRRFTDIACTLEGFTQRCYFSFASFYGKVRRRLEQENVAFHEPETEERRALVAQLAPIAAEHGITLYACCQDNLVGDSVQQASCVDADLLAELFPERPHVSRSGATREHCGCAASRDVGVYDTCAYGCLYCYATQSHDRALARLRAHDDAAERLAM